MPDIKLIEFSKMQGSGNDFVVIDNREIKLTPADIVSLTPDICRRRSGVGADGILLLEESEKPECDYRMVYRNADGSDAGMCGNGARCLALYASRVKPGNSFVFSVHDRQYRAEVKNENHIEIAFPLTVKVDPINDPTDKGMYRVNTGTEHIVLPVIPARLEEKERLKEKGEMLRHHDHFKPEGTNVNFFCDTGARSIRLRTYERGVEDLTLACGTGAIASALTWHNMQDGSPAENSFLVQTDGGALTVEFDFNIRKSEYGNITLIGPAQLVYNGEYYV